MSPCEEHARVAVVAQRVNVLARATNVQPPRHLYKQTTNVYEKETERKIEIETGRSREREEGGARPRSHQSTEVLLE